MVRRGVARWGEYPAERHETNRPPCYETNPAKRQAPHGSMDVHTSAAVAGLPPTPRLSGPRFALWSIPARRGGWATADAAALWTAFRALVNTRPPLPMDQQLLAQQDLLLRGLIAEAGVATIDTAQPSPLDSRLSLWRGDITRLEVDAIVNAANSQMLGCWAPGHACIDNAIHTFAGVQLRAECARIMEAQGSEEPTGTAKITSAYNLPSTHVIHTVGPIANGNPTDQHCAQLAKCYTSCLDLAARTGLTSIAFCCISTGVFGFPQAEAAAIAVRTVREWLGSHDAQMRVVFNVFSEADAALYRELLGI